MTNECAHSTLCSTLRLRSELLKQRNPETFPIDTIPLLMSYPLKNTDPVPKRFENIYQGRIRQFTANSGEYRDLNLAHYYDRSRIDDENFIKLKVFSVPDLQRPSFQEAMAMAKGNWHPTHKGDLFGPSWSTHWFRIELRIPSDWANASENPIFNFDSSDEGFYYTAEGVPVHGLSGEHRRTEIELSKEWIEKDDSEWHVFYIETSCNNITGVGTPADPNRQFRLNTADLVLPNSITRALYIDFWILGDCAREFPGGTWQKYKALDLCNKIINTFDRENVDESAKKCRELAATYFGDVDTSEIYRTSLAKHGNSDNKVHASSLNDDLVYCLGNCHIDTAWLWPYAETRRKVARSWSSQLELLEKYPEYVFVASQAVQFEWLKEDHPDLFKRIQEAVKGGRFIPIGGSWVENDTNMPNGESLVRQMCLGQQFFEREFGMKSKVFWLPDTFGYSPQIPQICRLADQPYFLTQKLSWNDIDKFPFSTFNWVGLDGSQVVCHMPPANTYTADANFGDVMRSSMQNRSLDTAQHSMMLFGYGDGGGGPTAEMIEKLRRCRGISDNVNILPSAASGPEFTPNSFFQKILDSTDNGKSLATWKGEMYLEYHRGTYTTQAAIKRGNRRSEVLMRDLEKFATTASFNHATDDASEEYVYPFEEIENLWKKVCLNQFHDVLPGSGITMIYEDARRIYDEIWVEGNNLLNAALKSLGCHTAPFSSRHMSCLVEGSKENDIKYRETAALRETHSRIPAYDFDNDSELQIEDSVFNLENNSFKLEFVNGKLVSILDKSASNREVLAPNSIGNQLLLLEDQPMNFPAWDTEQYSTEKILRLDPQHWYQHSEICAEFKYKFSKSTVTQKVFLTEQYIQFSTDVNWNETYQFLKVEFPVDILSDFATYETSFGNQRRPTHYNTSWDASKFEVCGHRYADLSQYDYGVSLLNDSKYGYSIHGNKMRLSLLRSPKNPDGTADMTNHSFNYALAPHVNGFSPETVRLAAEFNSIPYWIKSREAITVFKHTMYLFDSPSVVLSSLKRGFKDRYDGKIRTVARFYETMGGKTTANLFIDEASQIKNIFECNVLEEESSYKSLNHKLIKANNEEALVRLPMSPFEIKTIIVEYSNN